MRITIAVLVMGAITLFVMALVFDDVLPFSLSVPQVVAEPVVEAAPAVTTPASVTTSSVVQTQSLTQEETWSKGYMPAPGARREAIRPRATRHLSTRTSVAVAAVGVLFVAPWILTR